MKLLRSVRLYISGNGLEGIQPSPWHGALQCVAVTLIAESLIGLMHINEHGITSDTSTFTIAVNQLSPTPTTAWKSMWVKACLPCWPLRSKQVSWNLRSPLCTWLGFGTRDRRHQKSKSILVFLKQECIPAGCVATVAVVATRCQYRVGFA